MPAAPARRPRVRLTRGADPFPRYSGSTITNPCSSTGAVCCGVHGWRPAKTPPTTTRSPAAALTIAGLLTM